MPEFRPYTPADRESCLALFDSYCPPFFGASERADFEEFLSDPADHGEYLVLEQGGEVLACGGVWLDGNGTGGLSWGMVRRDRHGQGLGTRLTVHRLDLLRQRPGVRCVRLDTSQHSEGFYARHGFVATRRTADGFAAGFTEVKMVLELLADGAG